MHLPQRGRIQQFKWRDALAGFHSVAMAVPSRLSHRQEHRVSPAGQIGVEDVAAVEIVRELEVHPPVLDTRLANR